MRDPFDRLVSSVNQIYRDQASLHRYPELFLTFPSPSSLVTSISLTDVPNHSFAVSAYRTLPHVSKSYWSFFISPEFFSACTARILFVLDFHNLNRSINFLAQRLNLALTDTAKLKALSTASLLNRSTPSSQTVSYDMEIQNSFRTCIGKYEYDFYEQARILAQPDQRLDLISQRYGIK